jgi:ubiquinone/menaquinone biosynthesis C-methylase UbiE
MRLDVTKYWTGGHEKYSTLDWIDKPTIFAKQIIKYLPKKTKLLDLGAGQGQDSRFFAKNGFTVTCTDITPIAIKLAREKAKKSNLSMKFKKVDISKKLPFKNSEFDIVYSHLALHYFNVEDTTKIFSEIYRILKPDGVLVALFNSKSDPEIKEFKKIGDNLYLDPRGLAKSYWTAKYLRKFIDRKFNTVVLDDEGETYKDRIKTLVRFVGRKI